MSNRLLVPVLLACLSFCSPSSSRSGIVWDENVDTSLSQNNLLPTPLGTLGLGVSSVRGTIESALNFGNVDVFSFQIAAGTKLTEIRIPEYTSSDDIAVLGINNDNFFPFSPQTFNNTLTLTDLQQIIGVAQFGDGWVNTVGPDARDLLQSGTDPGHPALLPPNQVLNTASAIGSRVSGFKAFENFGPFDRFEELGPGTYTVYMQQLGDNTEYQIDFYVEAIPEPSSLALVGLFAAAISARRRR
jgi:hypothetical protein